MPTQFETENFQNLINFNKPRNYKKWMTEFRLWEFGAGKDFYASFHYCGLWTRYCCRDQEKMSFQQEVCSKEDEDGSFSSALIDYLQKHKILTNQYYSFLLDCFLLELFPVLWNDNVADEKRFNLNNEMIMETNSYFTGLDKSYY